MVEEKKIRMIREVQVYYNGDFAYIKFSELPEYLKKGFENWMKGQTVAYINGETVAYVWDFERYLSGKPIID